MKRYIGRVLCKFTVLLLTFAVGVLPVSAGLNPDFDLLTLDGGKSTLQSEADKGKWLLVMFWATDCVICERQKPLISTFHSEHKDTDAEVIGVALDGYSNVALIKDYLVYNKPSFPSFTGEYSLLAKRYFDATGEVLRGTPTYLLYTPEGVLVANNPGPVSVGAIEGFIEKYRKSHH